jgi:hypothetical protein
MPAPAATGVSIWFGTTKRAEGSRTRTAPQARGTKGIHGGERMLAVQYAEIGTCTDGGIQRTTGMGGGVQP